MMEERKEIAIIKVEQPVFFPGRFIGGRVEKQVLVLNPQEHTWKVFGWVSYTYKKKPNGQLFTKLSTWHEVLMAATEIPSREEGTYKYVYRGTLHERVFDEIMKLWERNKIIRDADD